MKVPMAAIVMAGAAAFILGMVLVEAILGEPRMTTVPAPRPSPAQSALTILAECDRMGCAPVVNLKEK